ERVSEEPNQCVGDRLDQDQEIGFHQVEDESLRGASEEEPAQPARSNVAINSAGRIVFMTTPVDEQGPCLPAWSAGRQKSFI
ncbi:MAG TPA: hypothetical protein DDY48_07070, partial [Erwinia persicina]|nr:hypothetical protein [Erwinia persicina]